MSRRALILANSVYDDRGLPPLAAPPEDARILTEVLEGLAFEVDACENLDVREALQRLDGFFRAADVGDELFLHYSGHGAVDTATEKLYLCTQRTEVASLVGTAIPGDQLVDLVRASRAQSIVVTADCCYSALLSEHLIGRSGAADLLEREFRRAVPRGAENAERRLDGLRGGRGLVVFAAAGRDTQAHERPVEAGSRPRPSPFTQALVEGLRGHADADGNDWIDIAELFAYVRDHVTTQNVPHPLIAGEPPRFRLKAGASQQARVRRAGQSARREEQFLHDAADAGSIWAALEIARRAEARSDRPEADRYHALADELAAADADGSVARFLARRGQAPTLPHVAALARPPMSAPPSSPGIALSRLPDAVHLHQLPRGGPLAPAIGLVEDDHAGVITLHADLARGLAFLGPPGSGRSSALMAFSHALVSDSPHPCELHAVSLDGGTGLDALRSISEPRFAVRGRVGDPDAVVGGVLSELHRRLAARRDGASLEDAPSIVLLIDGVASRVGETVVGLDGQRAFRLERLATDGSDVRMHLAISAATAADIFGRLRNRLDRISLSKVPGRGTDVVGRPVQLALPPDGHQA